MKYFSFIENALQQDRLPHALLLTGTNAAEKSVFIEKVVNCVLCLPEGSSAQGRHPDYYVLGEDGASIAIEEARNMQSLLEKTAHQNGYKVILIHRVDALSVYTANALLKILEEPLPKTLFILTADQGQKVLPTLRSRCVPILFSSPVGEPKEDDFACKETLFWGTYSLFNQPPLLEKILAETRETLYLFYYWVAEYCRYGLTKDPGHLSVMQEKSRYDDLLKILSVRQASQFLECLVKAIQSCEVTGLNKELLWGSVVMQWQQIKYGK